MRVEQKYSADHKTLVISRFVCRRGRRSQPVSVAAMSVQTEQPGVFHGNSGLFIEGNVERLAGCDMVENPDSSLRPL